jgi:hypothetical protein
LVAGRIGRGRWCGSGTVDAPAAGAGSNAVTTFEWFVVGFVVLAVLGGGSWVAMWWWKLAARAAPYQDEVARGGGTKGVAGPGGRVVVIGEDGGKRTGDNGDESA